MQARAWLLLALFLTAVIWFLRQVGGESSGGSTGWHTRWRCTRCGRHGRLHHDSLFFAPDVCPRCGADLETRERPVTRFSDRKNAEKVVMRKKRGSWIERGQDEPVEGSPRELLARLMEHEDPEVRQIAMRLMGAVEGGADASKS